MDNDVIALFEFEATDEGVKVVAEKHYRLVKPTDLSLDELESYRGAPILTSKIAGQYYSISDGAVVESEHLKAAAHAVKTAARFGKPVPAVRCTQE